MLLPIKKLEKKLQQKYGTLFWSPCAAHCIDLMLENIANPKWFPPFDEAIKKAKKDNNVHLQPWSCFRYDEARFYKW